MLPWPKLMATPELELVESDEVQYRNEAVLGNQMLLMGGSAAPNVNRLCNSVLVGRRQSVYPQSADMFTVFLYPRELLTSSISLCVAARHVPLT